MEATSRFKHHFYDDTHTRYYYEHEIYWKWENQVFIGEMTAIKWETRQTNTYFELRIATMKGRVALWGAFGVWQFRKLAHGSAAGRVASFRLAWFTKGCTVASRTLSGWFGRQRRRGVGVVAIANSLDEMIAEIRTVWLLWIGTRGLALSHVRPL